ncbi:MAG: M20/M25/M40 family metallo-hydrolase, partial [Verrucomicrobia bacterium]
MPRVAGSAPPATLPLMPASALQYLASHETDLVEDLAALVRIPSLSGAPEHRADLLRAAAYVTDRLRAAGLEHVETLPTGGHPVIYADWLHAGPDAPTVLLYGHYDVQPADPLELWESPPFAPAIRDNRLYGRGAADDKAGVCAAIAALGAMFASGDLPSVNVKICFEGEEEIGSPNLEPLLERERGRFAADLVISVDGGQWSPDQPQVILGLRGMIGLELHVRGPAHDLHSGLFGGAVLNPLEALARLLASMRAPDGRITVDGFYDDVVEP